MERPASNYPPAVLLNFVPDAKKNTILGLVTLFGLLPDHVLESQLGIASSLKTFMDTFSLVIAALLAGRMMDPQNHNPIPIMLVVICLLIVTGTIRSSLQPKNRTKTAA